MSFQPLYHTSSALIVQEVDERTEVRQRGLSLSPREQVVYLTEPREGLS